MVQRRAACYMYVTSRHQNESSVSDMLQSLNWQTLEDRRKDARLCILYRVDRRLVAFKRDRWLILQKRRQEADSRPSAVTQTKEGCHSSLGQSGTGMPYLQIYRNWVGYTMRLQGQCVIDVGPVGEIALNL